MMTNSVVQDTCSVVEDYELGWVIYFKSYEEEVQSSESCLLSYMQYGTDESRIKTIKTTA